MISSNLSTSSLLALTTFCFVATLLTGPQTARALLSEVSGWSGDPDSTISRFLLDGAAAAGTNDYENISGRDYGDYLHVDAYDLNKCGLGYQKDWQTEQRAFRCGRPTGRQIFLKPRSHWFWPRSSEKDDHDDRRHDRIANGVPALAGEHPWYVRLETYRDGRPAYCGGVLIHDNLVLTAAHCLENGESIVVILGTNMVDGSNGGLRWTADRWCFNADGSDSGILRLREPVRYEEQRIAPACLKLQPAHDPLTACQATGMGYINDRPDPATQLMTLLVRRRCPQENPGPFKSCYVADRFGATCPGDSGAPVLCWDKCGTQTTRAYAVGHITGGPTGSTCGPNDPLWHFSVSDYNRQSAKIPQYIRAIRSGPGEGLSDIKCFSPKY